MYVLQDFGVCACCGQTCHCCSSNQQSSSSIHFTSANLCLERIVKLHFRQPNPLDRAVPRVLALNCCKCGMRYGCANLRAGWAGAEGHGYTARPDPDPVAARAGRGGRGQQEGFWRWGGCVLGVGAWNRGGSCPEEGWGWQWQCMRYPNLHPQPRQPYSSVLDLLQLNS